MLSTKVKRLSRYAGNRCDNLLRVAVELRPRVSRLALSGGHLGTDIDDRLDLTIRVLSLLPENMWVQSRLTSSLCSKKEEERDDYPRSYCRCC